MFLESLQDQKQMTLMILPGHRVDQDVVQVNDDKLIQQVRKILFIKCWKTAGALVNLNGMTMYLKYFYGCPFFGILHQQSWHSFKGPHLTRALSKVWGGLSVPHLGYQGLILVFFQALIEVPCEDLARELAETPRQTQRLQETLQETLDRREEERRSRQLLELYLQAIKKENRAPSTAHASEPEEKSGRCSDTVDTGNGGPSSVERTQLSSRVVTVLKEKPSPELSLASQDLELVCKEDSEALCQALRWDKHKTETLKEACGQELSRRLQQFRSLNSLRSISKGKKKQPEPGEQSSSKRRK
ncbi:PREDICTED: DNA fragmentation factor subunit alpha [Thamnophis sirtalis]|uniref:DNAation factor subunit alpha n=1 Tax=Thamnophis sirtalis TaxID=35019 RepID=A0A6I9XP60_9SAUR|nr:PREDICTED: DNA fragmentation factor subunit alpha [Thamnophis sirtalis]